MSSGEAMKRTSPKRVIEARFGNDVNYKKIAEEEGVSLARIRCIESKAITKMRKKSSSLNIKYEFENDR